MEEGLKIHIGADIDEALNAILKVTDAVKGLSNAAGGTNGVNISFKQTVSSASEATTGLKKIADSAKETAAALQSSLGSITFSQVDTTGLQSAIQRFGEFRQQLLGLPGVASQVPASISREFEGLAKTLTRVDFRKIKDEIGSIKVNVSAGQSLGILEKLENEAKRLGIELRKATDPETARKLAIELKNVNSQITAVRGGTAFNALNASSKQAAVAIQNVGRVVSDLPYGFIGIQNNIEPLLESFQRLSLTSKESGGVLKSLGSALLSGTGVILAFSVLSSIITGLVREYGSLGAALQDIFGLLSATEKAQQNLNKVMAEATGNAASEKAEITALLTVAKDKEASDLARERALKKLNDTYGDVLPALNKENVALIDIKKSTEAATMATFKMAAVKGLQKLIAQETEKAADAMLELKGGSRSAWNFIKDLFNGFNGGILKAQLDRVNGTINESSDKIQVYQKGINDLYSSMLSDKPVGSKEELSNLEKQSKYYKEQIDAKIKIKENQKQLNEVLAQQKAIELRALGFDENFIKGITDAIRKGIYGAKDTKVNVKVQTELQQVQKAIKELEDFGKVIDLTRSKREELFTLKVKEFKLQFPKANAVDLKVRIAELQRELKLTPLFIDIKYNVPKIDTSLIGKPDPNLLTNPITGDNVELERKRREEAQATLDEYTKMANTIADTVTPVFTSMFDAVLEGNNVFDALKNSLKDIAKQLVAAAAKAAIFAAIMALIPGVGQASAAAGVATKSFGQNFLGQFKSLLGFSANPGTTTGIRGRALQANMNQQLVAEVSGQKLQLLLQRTNNSNLRYA